MAKWPGKQWRRVAASNRHGEAASDSRYGISGKQNNGRRGSVFEAAKTKWRAKTARRRGRLAERHAKMAAWRKDGEGLARRRSGRKRIVAAACRGAEEKQKPRMIRRNRLKRKMTGGKGRQAWNSDGMTWPEAQAALWRRLSLSVTGKAFAFKEKPGCCAASAACLHYHSFATSLLLKESD